MTRTARILVLLISLIPLTGCRATSGSGVAHTSTGSGMHYIDAGPRLDKAIVFVHGWASDHTVWDEQFEAFDDQYRVLAVDLPGHGRSARGNRPWSMAMMARGIARAMDDAGVARAVLVGHSNGTPTAREFYRLFPERTSGLVAVDGALVRVVEPEMIEPILVSFRSENHADVAARFTKQTVPKDAPYRERLLEMVGRTSQDALVGGIEAQIDDEIWKQDPIDVPLLVINADAPFWDDAYRSTVQALAPDLEYRTLTGVSHFLFLDNPNEFTRILRDWLERKDLP